MERLMYDVYIAEAAMNNDFQNFGSPEQKEAYIRQIFNQHRVTQAQWDATLAWYADRIDLYLQMNDSVMARMQRERTLIDAKIAQRIALLSNEDFLFADSHIPRVHAFSGPSTQNGFSFRLDSTEIADLPYDDFSFDFTVTGIPSTGVPGFQALLTLDYIDTTIYRLEKISENIAYTIPIQRFIERDSVTLDTLRQLRGFVRLPDIHRVFRSIQMYDILLGNEPEIPSEEEEMKGLKRWITWIKNLFGKRTQSETVKAESLLHTETEHG
jgi:hypothetical protein